MRKENSDLLTTRGILKPERAPVLFDLKQLIPTAHFAAQVEFYWSVTWDIIPEQTFEQKVLSHPNLHVVIEPERAYIAGIPSACYTRELKGSGRAHSIKLLPGMATTLLPGAAKDYTDKERPLADIFDAHEVQELQQHILNSTSEEQRREYFERFLTTHMTSPRDAHHRAQRYVELIQNTPEIIHVEALAKQVHESVRTLQRLFTAHVGVSPKWVIKRYRLHEAAEQLETNPDKSVAEIAQELGYFDQAHFSNEFKTFTGESPSHYQSRTSET